MPRLEDIQEAHQRIRGLVRRTPLLYSESCSHLAGCPVYLKAENLQRTGSFKLRGASNRLVQLSPTEARRGVITASAGNHAQGVALAAALQDVPCTVVMPETASLAKYEATRGYGATVVQHGESYDEAVSHARSIAQESGQVFVHAFEDAAVVAGQGTIALEVLEDLPDAELIVVPVGGGGLLGGIAAAARALRPRVRLVGVQASAAPAAYRSFHRRRTSNRVPGPTLADGIAVGRPGRLAMDLIRRHVDDIVTVDDEAIVHALVLLMERSKLLVEPAGAAGLAALLSGRIDPAGRKTVVVLSGGNLDIALLARIVEHGLSVAGRYLVLQATLPDRPGELSRLLDHIAAMKGNVVDVSHHRSGLPLAMGQAEVELTVEVQNREHGLETLQRLRSLGYAENRLKLRSRLSG